MVNYKIKDLLKRKSKNAKQAVLDRAKEILPYRTIDNFEELEDLAISEFGDDAEEIIAISQKSYPRYTPFYIYEIELKEEISIFEKIVLEFVSPKDFEFKINDRYKLSCFEFWKEDNIFSIKALLSEYKIRYDYNRNINGSQKINEEDIVMYFHYNENLLLINTGKDTVSNLIYHKFLTDNFHDYISLNPLKISLAKLNNIKTDDINYDKITIFMLELLTEKLSGSKISVNNYKTLGIGKPNSDRIKSVVLRGNELNKESDIAVKLTQGYQLKKADVQIRYILNSNGDTYDVTISLALQSTLKVIIIEGESRKNNYRIIVNIYKNIIDLMNEEIEVKNMWNRYFPDVLSRRNTQMNVFKEKIKIKVENDKILKNKWDTLEIWIKELY